MTKLKNWLIDSEVFFIPRGEHNIGAIYTYVEASVPKMCDNSVPCSHSENEYGQPEWKHQVRLALNKLKDRGVIENVRHGVWKVK